MSGENTNLIDGMERMLKYHECLLKDKELIKMCENCEAWNGNIHDYNECKNCQGFNFYCELKEYRFIETFKE